MALDDYDGKPLFRRDNCDGEPRGSAAAYDEIPYLARGRRCAAGGESASHSASPLQQDQLAAEAGTHREQHPVVAWKSDVRLQKVSRHEQH